MRSTGAGLVPALAALLLTPAAAAGIVVDAGADDQFQARAQQALVAIANSPVAAIQTLYRAADTAAVTVTIRPLTDDPATWNEDRDPEQSHTEPVDGLPKEAGRTAPTGAIVFLNPEAFHPDSRRWAGGTLIHELVHAADLAHGRYHPDYEVRERRAILIQNIWRAQKGYKLREDYHGFETRDYQNALRRGRLDALVQYVFLHADLPAKPGFLDEAWDQIVDLAWRDIAETALGLGLGALALWILWHALKKRGAGNAGALHPELRLRIIGAAIGGIALCVASLISVGLAFATADLRDPKLDAVVYAVLFAGAGLATAWLAFALPVPRIAHYRWLGWVLKSQPARPVTAIIESVVKNRTGWPVAIAVRVENGPGPADRYEYAWPGPYARERIGRKVSVKAHVDPQTGEPVVLATADGMLWRRAPR